MALQRARDIASRVTGALGGRGVLGVEIFVKDDTVWFFEVSPRPHDTGLVTLATQRLSEFEPVSYTHLDVYKRQVWDWALRMRNSSSSVG